MGAFLIFVALLAVASSIHGFDAKSSGPSNRITAVDCGGLINLPAAYSSTEFQYISAQGNETSSEHCIWTLNDARFQGQKSRVKITVTLTSVLQGLERLAVLMWDPWKGLSSKLIESQEPVKLGIFDRFYLSYSRRSSAQEIGFSVNIKVDQFSFGYNGDNLVFSNPTGSFSYGPSKDGDRRSISVNPMGLQETESISFNLNYVDIENSMDCQDASLRIYEILPEGSILQKTMVCDMQDSILTFSTRNPVVVLFMVGTKPQGGFDISWSLSKS